jgi:pyruvate kinase
MDVKLPKLPPKTTTQATTPPLTTSASTTTSTTTTTQAAATQATKPLDGVDQAVRSPLVLRLDQLWSEGKYGKIVDVLAEELRPLEGADFKGLGGEELVGLTAKVYLLEERLKATLNKLSMTDGDGAAAKKKGLELAQRSATVSTAIFRRAVELQDAADPQPVLAWVVAKDTHKKAHKWTPEEHLAYVAQKTVEFYLKGGSESQIANVDATLLDSLKSGALCEYVVDGYDVARAAVVEEGKPSPGHTVLAQGNDALTAGTFEVQKNARREVTQILVGTFSGHFRTGFDAQEHLVRHLMAALGQMYPGKTPAELASMIVRREGQATNPRTIEVIGRGIGLDGAEAQRLETQLKAEAMRWQPMQLLDGGKTKPTGVAADVLALKDKVTGAIKDGLFLAPSERKPNPKAPADAYQNVGQILADVDVLMKQAIDADNHVVGGQLIGTLEALERYVDQLPAATVDDVARKQVESLVARWGNGVAGVTGADLGLLFSPKPTADRSTRIVATVNPKATDAQLKDMLKAGMDVARFNTAHGSVDDKIVVLQKLRRFAAEMGRDITIQVDLEGPKIRLGKFENPKGLEKNDIFLKTGDKATLTTSAVAGSQAKMLFPVDYPSMCADVKPGDPVSMNDGTVQMRVTAVDAKKGTVEVEVIKGGKVWDNKGVAFPQSKLSGNTVTDEDLQNLTALLPHVDIFAQSFVQSAADVVFLRERMRDLGEVKPILAKIERGNIALDEAELTKIALVSEGLMVARGDLGVELGEAQLPVAERLIRDVGEKTGRPVMLATEVMMSVLNESRASRGDVDALFGAVADRRFHAVMLGKETSAHANPGDVIREASGYMAFAESQRDKPVAKQPEPVKLSAREALFARGRAAPTTTTTTAATTTTPKES